MCTHSLSAQPPAGSQPNPQAPTLAAPFPMGMQRGTTLDLTLTGGNLADPIAVMTSFPAKVTIPTENNNGKEAGKLLVRLDVPKDAPLGWHTLRVATKYGVSNFRLFCLDDLPQVLEAGGNNALQAAQAVPVPSVVCGRADPEQTDYFKFTALAGQRISFEVLGRRLGSGLDPQVTLINPRTGKQLAFSDDAPAQAKDSRLVYTFKEAGEYVVELRDVRYQGGGDWHYRLRIGDFPLATTPVPLAAKRGSTVQVGFAGPHVESVPPVTVVVPDDPKTDVMWIWPSSAAIFPTYPAGLPGWPVALMITDLDETAETEPNDEPAKANRINVPGAVSARLQKKGERDHFVFAAKKGQRLIIEVQTQEFYSPTAVYMVLNNAKGEKVAASDPAKDPARIDFTAAEDADYTLAVEHLHYWGGAEEVYRFTILPPEPGFELTATLDRHDVPRGGVAIVTVEAKRQDFNGAIEVRVAEPSSVTGLVTIPEGKTAALLPLAGAGEAPIAAHRLVLAGKAKVNNKDVEERVHIRPLVSRDLGNMPFPPRHLFSELAVAVTEKPPFTLEAKYEHPEGVRGIGVPVRITATKAADFDEEITVTSFGLPVPQGQQPTVPAINAKIPKGQTQVKAELKPAANAPLGAMPLAFAGKGKHQNREFGVTAPPAALNLALPFELRVEAPAASLLPAGGEVIKTFGPLHVLDIVAGQPQPLALGTFDIGFLPALLGKYRLKVTADRKGGYKGPITLEARNLPGNVTANKPTIAEGQIETFVEVTIPANAATGEKKDVNVLGTATAAGNQQNASANFTLNVGKK